MEEGPLVHTSPRGIPNSRKRRRTLKLTRKERRRDVSNFLAKKRQIFYNSYNFFFIILIILFLQLGFLPIEAPLHLLSSYPDFQLVP